MGIFSAIGNAIRAAAAKVGQGLAFTGNAFANVSGVLWFGVNFLWDWTYDRVDQVIQLPRRAVFGEGGMGGGQIIPPADYSSEIREAQRGLRRQVEQNRHQEFAQAPDTLGKQIWDYAAAPVGERAMIDLDSYPLRVSSWLTSLSGMQLKKLATAGPEICERVANGNRPGTLGLRGIPECEAPTPDAGNAVRKLLAERLTPGGLSAKPRKKDGGDCRPE